MILNTILIYLLCFSLGILVLFIAFTRKKTFDRNKQVLSGERPKEHNIEDNSKKNKQQIELELLIINNNKFLKFLGLLDKNVKLKIIFTLLVSFIYYLFNLSADSTSLMLAFSVIFILIVIIPGILTNVIINKKIKGIMVDLPGFIDLVAVCIQTGVTIDAALKRISMDFKTLNPDLTYVMLRILRKGEIAGLHSALDDLVISLPTREIRMFCNTLQQSLNFGSSIYSNLIQLSADIRELQLLTIEERLGTLSAKMSIPLIVFIMFPIVILIIAPGMMRVFPNVF
ncbi:tight adherence protein C [Volucribacter psittacicida]|uniref:Tight adherence protein C n=1 Tax=Volucribacter psittacicida TaxID=203482 RepID=A0A4R1FS77_9PAST|nr:type II secretion system F family protein [Volucribacter psittacicida]TCJ97827.1 tight adherence protein C [Volucribacter psittacicida]